MHFYCLAVEANFYSDMVECLPVDPASWVRFPAGTGKIFSLYDICFMTSDLTCIEASDKKFPLVCTVGVLQGDHLVQIFYYTIHSLLLQECWCLARNLQIPRPIIEYSASPL